MKDTTVVAVAAITALTFLEGTALMCGIDGQILSTVIGVLGVIAGYAYRVRREKKSAG